MSYSNELSIEILSPMNRIFAKQMVLQLLSELDNTNVDETLYSKSVDDFLEDSKSVVYVAKYKGKYIGVITAIESIAIYSQGSYGVIQELFVLPEARSLSVGERLMNAMKNHAIKAAWSRLEVTTPAPSEWPRTVSFYKRLGFEEIGFRMKLII